jgi:hypothetical protein
MRDEVRAKMTNSTSESTTAPVTDLTVPLSQSARQQLDRRAAERGVPVEEFARAVLEREAATTPTNKSAEQWVADWRAFLASQPKRELHVDDSRESIYEGCGE